MIGMPYDLYWFGDPWLAASYYKADELRRQRKSDEMWIQGVYNFEAVSTALSNLNFGKRKRKPNSYRQEPIRVIPLSEAEQEAKAEKERKRVIEYFTNLEKKWKRAQSEKA